MVELSVIVPTYNRLERLKLVLSSIENQTLPNEYFELIVVSDGSTDGTFEFLSSWSTPLNFKFVQQENQGVAVTRNTGIEQASGEYILFVDDDVVPADNLLEAHLSTHDAHPNDIIVIGPMLNPEDFELQPWVAWEQAMLYKQYQAMLDKEWEPTARQFYTGNTSLRRHYLEITGGFDPTFRRAEDIELAYRLANLGLKFVFNEDAIGSHYAQRSFASWLKIPYQYGRNDVIFCLEKNQPWILPAMAIEFRGRHPFIRALAYITLDTEWIAAPLISLFQLIGQLCGQLNLKKFSLAAYSVIFNIRHYQGISDELGGRDAFFSYIETYRNVTKDTLVVPGN
ncbi:MAG: glycosyltransferase family 2 protein [Chloroflexota bacterium]